MGINPINVILVALIVLLLYAWWTYGNDDKGGYI